MKPTQEQIEGAIKVIYQGATPAEDIIVNAYRSEHARAELLERQYLELQNTYWRVSDQETEALIERHVREREALE
jgi:hypothetical protein